MKHFKTFTRFFGKMRHLALLLLCLLTASTAWAAIGETNFSASPRGTTVDQNGNVYYEFNMLYFNYDGSNCHFVRYGTDTSKQTWITVDGIKIATVTEICESISAPYIMGKSSNEDEASKYNDKDGFAGGIVKDVAGLGKVSVAFINPHSEKDTKAYWVYVRVGLEDNNISKNHTIGVSGWWKRYNEADAQINWSFTTGSVTCNPLNISSYGTFTRSNGKVSYTSPDFSAVAATKDVAGNNVNWTYNVKLCKQAPSDSQVYTGDTYAQQSVGSKDVTLEFNTTAPVSNGNTVSYVADNYLPVTLYPRFELKGSPYNITDHSKLHNDAVYFSRNWGAVVIPGYPRPTSLTATPTDSYTKSVKVTWDPELSDAAHASTDGQWKVFRAVTGSGAWTELGTVNYSSTGSSYIDKDDSKAYYDEEAGEKTTYDYCVVFVPTNWTVGSPAEAAGLSATASGVKIERTFGFSSFTSDATKTAITLTWKFNAISNASTAKPSIVLARSEDDGVSWKDIFTQSVTSNSTTQGTFTDSGLKADFTYKYRVMTNVQGKDFSATCSATLDGGTKLTGLSASRGTEKSSVIVRWTVDQVGTGTTYFTIDRRKLGGKDTDWKTISSLSGTATEYTYQDISADPGTYYEYRVTLKSGTRTSQMITDGFCLSTGILSGRVYYDSGTAVKDVKVSLTPSDGSNGFRSVQLEGDKAGIFYFTDNAELKNIFGGNNTVQVWVKPDSEKMNEINKAYTVCWINGTFGIWLYKWDDGFYHAQVFFNTKTRSLIQNIQIPGDEWSQITIVSSHNPNKTQGFVTLPDGKTYTQGTNNNNVIQVDSKAKAFCIGRPDVAADYAFQGSVDEVRVFTRALTQSEIESNIWHSLSGNEPDLALYWPMDEGIAAQNFCYDVSKKDGVANARHGSTEVPATSSIDSPASTGRFTLSGVTDANGDYEVRGIPFSGEGTNYVITPTLGIHSFNPSKTTRFFSQNSLIYSGVDFIDNSSFPVSGTVRYAGTDIPVKGVSFKIDGTVAARDGKIITTDDNGEYTIDVPIGDHFIELELQGHTFMNNGRYPADPNKVGTRHTFEGEVTHLDFYDETTVVVAGRVAGGDVENAKPLGLGDGKNNIGVATLTLGYTNAQYNINTASSERTYENATGDCKATTAQGSRKIVVKTDPKTGEFAVKLPPLIYNIESVTIDNNKEITNLQKPMLDATNVLKLSKDSLMNDYGTYDYFEYVAAAKIEYKAPSQMDVVEREDGSFGRKTIDVTDINGKTSKVDLYTIDPETKAVSYTFDYPVYQQLDRHRYALHAYERYVNYDVKDKPVEDIVPLAGSSVTIKNQFSTAAAVYYTDGSVCESESKDIQFELDSLGCATYDFAVGLPNIQSPYTRGISITYGADNIKWPGSDTFKAIVLGTLTKGNDFVTDGPDELLMVLRDPPGSNSQITWSKGSSSSFTRSVNTEVSSDLELSTVSHLGAKVETGFGGLAVVKIEDVESVCDLTVGTEIQASFANAHSRQTTTTITKDISTSDGTDFVGAVGDVFIGSSKNRIYGACTQVKVAYDEVEHKPVLVCDDAFQIGESFGTSFTYTQNFIENVLLGSFAEKRDALIHVVADVNSVAAPAAGEDPIYVSTLSKDDERFGSDNNDADVWGDKAKPFEVTKSGGKAIAKGPSYTIILPVDYEQRIISDQVQYFNTQINNWIKHLARNEENKVKAIRDRSKYLKENFSFDAGASVTMTTQYDSVYSHQYTETEEVNLVVGAQTGVKINETGVVVSIQEKAGEKIEVNEELGSQYTTSFSYTLKEDGDDDYLSVDVFDAPDNFGPIFYTRGGATCAPYEDEVVTKYYEPGTIISQKTLQIEKPELEVIDQVVTGVPAGKDAIFRIKIRNLSETGEDCYYGLWVNPETNPNGAQIFMDGINITPGVDILVPAGEEMIKTCYLRQTNKDILDYEGISLSLYSTSQPDDTGIFPGIYSDAEIEVHFQAACSDIDLAASSTTVNTESPARLEFYMSGYDYNMQLFQTLRLEYKGEHDSDFKVLKTFVKDADRLNNYLDNGEDKDAEDANKPGLIIPLTGAQKLTYSFDLTNSNWQDQAYIFRAVTAGMVNGTEVTTTSDEIRVVRDMSRPQLIATPTPVSGVLTAGDDISITFNEDIRQQLLTKTGNFTVEGTMNDTEVAHEVALNLASAETAKTQTTIDLAGKDFAASLWVNYSADGQFLSHGTSDNAFTLATVGGKVAVTFGGATYTSTETLPKDKWVYLNLSLSADGLLNVGYAMDATTKALLENVETSGYQGNGPLALGGTTFVGKVQELALWNVPRTLIEALAEKDVPKSQYTTGIIGYWKFDEGHGTIAEDDSRSRHITVPANAWWIAGTNYSAQFDGTKAVRLTTGSISTFEDESYLVEGWFRADAAQTGEAALLSVDANTLRLQLADDGTLQLVTKGALTEVTKTSLRDGQWHHIALNVLKSTNGSATVYVDGQPVKQLTAAAVSAFNGSSMVLGAVPNADYTAYSKFLKGNIDEVRIWKGRRTADVIVRNIYNGVQDTADGLVAYYTFDKSWLDEYNQPVYGFSLEDRSHHSADARVVNASAYDVADPSSISSVLAPPVKAAHALEQVGFNFVASERQIKLTLNENPYKIEGQTIYITAHDIRDLNGNACEPITWSVYVQQNSLHWSQQEVAVSKVGTEEVTFSVDLENMSAASEPYVITDLPSWLRVSSESGTLPPLSKRTLTFTVNAAVPSGSYEISVYALGSQNIPTPLALTLTAENEAPNWVAANGEFTMNVIGQLMVDGVYSSDSRDMVAAFIDDKCVGVAHPTYYSKYDAYIVLMDIYGNAKDNGKPLAYKMFDASTGTIYPSVAVDTEGAKKFVADNFVGKFTKRVIFTPEDKVEQNIAVSGEGWKWFSLYVRPEEMTPQSIFSTSADAVKIVTSGSQTMQHDGDSWIGNLTALNNASMYKVNTLDSFEQSVIGASVRPADVPITLNTSWTWMGYPVAASNTLDEALAGADPQEEDVVKAQSGFALYTGQEWIGSLKALVPGEGYYYFSNASAPKTFTFPVPSMAKRAAARHMAAQSPLTAIPYRDNMIMVAVVMMGDEVVEDATVTVLAGEEVHGLSEQTYGGKHFVTIGSNQRAEMLDIVVTTGGGTIHRVESIAFDANAQFGTYAQPYVLQIAQTTGIGSNSSSIANITIYDAQGRMVASEDNPTSAALQEQGLMTGVYVEKITYTDGRTQIVKISK